MPLDPQAQQVMEQIAALGFPPNHTVSPEQARINAQARPRVAGPEVARVEQRRVPGSGADIPVRIYTPAAQVDFCGPVNWLGAGLESPRQQCRGLLGTFNNRFRTVSADKTSAMFDTG
jgi:acetyl esterase